MYYIIYETTNLINNKKYRGAHISDDLEDGYLGSGKLLKKAIKKYGIENFKRTILEFCDSLEILFIRESYFVDKDWVSDINTYNLKIGGEGGWDYINKNSLRWTEEKRKIQSLLMKKKRELGEWGPKNPTYGFKGKQHSDFSKLKISENNKMKLPEDIIKARIEQYQSLPDVRGKIKKLSDLWEVSHTQVRRFIIKHNLRVA